MEKKLLPYLVLISALSVSLSAAFYSVTGLAKMFSGASVQVMIMMSSLEISKLVLASLLYQYWGKLNKALRTYYFVALFVLMSITSAGIYGYLSSAYSDTLNKVENIDKQVKVLDAKREMFQVRLDDTRSEKERLNQNISELTKGVSNNFIQSRDRNGNIITTTSSANRRVYEDQLKSSQKRRDDLLLTETALNDSITKIDLKKLELETNTDIAGEIGPLKYISKLTGKSMDQVINWFIIALMLVFDPLAVSLIVGANVIFRDKKKEAEKLLLSKEIDVKIDEFEGRKLEMIKLNQDLDDREKEVSNKEVEIQNRSIEQDNKFDDRVKELEMSYLEKQKEIDIKNLELVNLESEFNNKVESITNDFKLKESTFEAYVSEEKSNIESSQDALAKLKEELDQKEKSIDSVVNSKIDAAKLKLEEKVKELNREKKDIQTQKSDIKKELSEISSERENLEKMRDELLQRESDFEKSSEEIRKLDEEIRAWENQNWMLKRSKGYNGPPPPPPSAIV